MSTLQQLRNSVRAKILGFLFFLGVLADVFGVTDRLDAVSTVVAAFVPLTALAGTLFFSVLLLERILWWVADRRNDGPKRREFASKHELIDSVKSSLGMLEYRLSSAGRSNSRSATFHEAATEVEVLTKELDHLGIPTLPELQLDTTSIGRWYSYVTILEVYARDGNYELAREFKSTEE